MTKIQTKTIRLPEIRQSTPPAVLEEYRVDRVSEEVATHALTKTEKETQTIQGYLWSSEALKKKCLEHVSGAFYAEKAGVKNQFEMHLQESIDLYHDDLTLKVNYALDKLNIRPSYLPKLFCQTIPKDSQKEFSFRKGDYIWHMEPIEKFGNFIPARALKALDTVKEMGIPFEEYRVASDEYIPLPRPRDPYLVGRIGRKNWVVIAQWL